MASLKNVCKKAKKLYNFYRVCGKVYFKNGVSYKNKLLFKDFHTHVLFIHIPKAAGMSIVKSVYNINTSHHASIGDYYLENKEKTENITSFAVVRNPYSRLISAYNYLSHDGKALIDEVWNYLYLKKFRDINDFVENGGLEKAVEKNAEHFIPQIEFVSYKGIIEVEKIFKFEEIGELQRFLLQEGFKIILNRENKGRVEVKTDNFKEILTEKSIKKINSIYEMDFKKFNYEIIK